MINNNFVKGYHALLPQESLQLEEPMKNHTTFHVGGNADALISISHMEQLQKVLSLIQKYQLPYFVMGNGSNLLISDEGYHGVIIKIAQQMSTVSIQDNILTMQAGTLLGSAARQAMNAGLTGMEFAAGIPGTAGGAMVMNAGAYDGEMKQIVESVTLLDEEGTLHTFSNEEMEFGYRTSILKKRRLIVLEVSLRLCYGNQKEIAAKMADFTARRKEKQPLEYPSAGSTFKRPQGHYAGKLIMDAGLKGATVGDAQVAEKHCGFIINKGNASAADIYQLIMLVKKQVREDFGVELEPEVIFLGEFK